MTMTFSPAIPSLLMERTWRPFWISLGGAAIVALFGILGPTGGSIWSIERSLQGRVQSALARANLRTVSVDMRGQVAHLVGAVPTEEAREAAIDAALTAAGPGGPWLGGVTKVVSENLLVGAPPSPYTWRATRRGQRITLSGHALSARIKRQLYARARDAFAGMNIVDDVRVAPGAPDGGWTRVAEDAMTQLARLRQGEARLSDAHLVILGDGDANAVDRVSAHYRGFPPAPYRTRVEIEVTGEGLGIADLGELNLAEARAETCHDAFARMMARNVVSFQTGSAQIDRSSLRLLDHLASIALRCDSYAIEIAGHTDNVGARTENVELSRRRAAAVAGYLIGQGVNRERLRAIGHGPDQPRASNSTAVGRAANRRIEFRVT